ncbi:hypothetical protein CASFOL_037143 [Castilleja foliolosa]|uniref:Epidermal patterning factor-like protein n=1 Tax=Castilleja foliolosa TaxID=1961234 RepID=A0ABD3BN76_9LAMI
MVSQRHLHFSIYFLLLAINLRSIFHAEGRKLTQPTDFSSTIKRNWPEQIGSRPPRCERRCGGCGQCEAIQVPTSPQIKSGIKNSITAVDDDDDDESNYKPLSWKCKCGNIIFNP